MSGLDYEDWLTLHFHKNARRSETTLKSRGFRDNVVIGYDVGMKGNTGDFSAMTIAKTPGRLRKFLRRIGLDRSTWKFKIVSQTFNRTGERVD